MIFSYEKLSDRYLEVNSCGTQQLCDRNYRRHRKDGRCDWHILYITKGRSYLTEKGERLVAEKGDIVIYAPFEEQCYGFLGADRSVSNYIHFSGTGVEELMKACGLFGKRKVTAGDSPQLESIFAKMRDEYILKKENHIEAAAAYLMQFLVIAGRCAAKTADPSPDSARSIDAVCRMIHDRTCEPLTVKECADFCHLSLSRFEHIFKDKMGVSPKNYINKVKVTVACDLISESDLTVRQAAEAVGITDCNYFSRLVKKYTGFSPSYFKER